MTLTDIASERSVDVTSLKRKLRRAGVEPPKSNDEPLEQSVVDLLTTDKRKAKQNGGVVATLKKDFETPIKMPEIKANPKAHHQNGSQDVHSHTEDEKGRQNVPKRLNPNQPLAGGFHDDKVGELIEKHKQAGEAVKRAFEASKKESQQTRLSKFVDILPILPLPSLGLAASWGVYHFSLHFVPMPVAIAEAAGFELVYIGLALSTGLGPDLRKRVTQVSLAAVAVSVIYNAISAALYAKTGGDMAKSHAIVEGLHPVLFWVVAILHGAPLAILAYFVSNLVIHQRKRP